MADVFISYSRKDRDFVKRLHEALAAADRDVWIDWEDIPLTADWWAEICTGIDAADTFVFVISPDSVRSEVCRDEIQHAVENHKRFVPILYRDLDDEASAVMHSAVSSHNWIFFRTQDGFDVSFQALSKALDTDLSYVREHTRLLVRALEWNREGRNRSFLLDGTEVQRAEIWLADSFDNNPPPTDLHYEYIRASRANETRRQRLLIGGLSVALVVALMLTGLALLGFNDASIQAGNAQTQAAIAAIAQGQAQTEAARATSAQGRAQIEADNAQTQAAIAATSEAQANIQATAVAQQRDRVATAEGDARVQAEIAQTEAARATVAQGRALIEAANAQTQAALVATAEGDARIQADIAQTQAARATSAQGRAQIEADNAQTQAARAATAEGEARIQADLAQTEAAIATVAQGRAQIEAANAQTQAALAATNEAKANIQADIAATNEAAANIQATAVAQQRDRAATAEADARFQADFAQTQAARAEIAQATAIVNEYQARSQALAASAQRLLETGNPDLALALALEASRLNPALTQAQLILNRAAPFSVRLSFDATPVTGTRAERNVALARYVAVPYETYPFTGLFSPDERFFVLAPDGITLEVWDIASRERVYTLNGLNALVSAAVFSPNSRYLVTGTEDGQIVTWDMTTGAALQVMDAHNGRVNTLDYDDTSNRLVSGGDDFQVYLWDAVQGQLLARLTEATGSHGHPVRQAFFGPERAFSFDFASQDPQVGVWPLANGEDGFFRRVPRYRSVDADSVTGFTGGDGTDFLKLWDAVSLAEIRTFTLVNANEDYIPHYALRPFSRELLVYVETRDNRGPGYTVTDRYLALWDYSNGSERRRLETGPVVDDWSITSIAVSPDGDLALTGGVFGRIPTVTLWDLNTGREIRRFTGHDDTITRVAFSPDGQYAFSWAAGNTRIWDISERETTEQSRIAIDSNRVAHLGLNPPGTGVYAVVTGRDVGLWDLETGAATQRLFAGGQVAAAAYSPTDPYVFTALRNPGSGTIWDMNSGTFIYRMLALDISVRVATFDSSGAYLVAGGNEWRGDPLNGEPRQEDTLMVWSVARQRVLHRLNITAAEPDSDITHVALSPDASTAAVAYSSGAIVLWDVDTGTELRRLTGQEGPINDLDYSPDGRDILAALGAPTNSLIVWDAATGDQTLTLIGHRRAVTSAAFSPDSTTAISASEDNTLILWDLFTGQPLRRLTGHSAPVVSVAFSPDGHTVVSGNARDGIIVWRIETLPETVAWTVANRYIPELSCSQRSQYNVTPLCLDGIVPTPTATGTLFPSATPTITPTPTPTATATPTPIPTAIVTATENAIIRNGPGQNFGRVGSVSPGTRVIVLQVRRDIGWVQVRLPDGTEGWIAAVLLEMER